MIETKLSYFTPTPPLLVPKPSFMNDPKGQVVLKSMRNTLRLFHPQMSVDSIDFWDSSISHFVNPLFKQQLTYPTQLKLT